MMITTDATLSLGNGRRFADGAITVTGITGENAGNPGYDATHRHGSASFGEAYCVCGHRKRLVREQQRQTSHAPLTGNKGRQ